MSLNSTFASIFSSRYSQPLSQQVYYIALQSSNGHVLEAPKNILLAKSKVIVDLMAKLDLEKEESIPVNIKANVLEKIIEWLNHHEDDQQEYSDLKPLDAWDRNFLSSAEKSMLFGIVQGSNFLEIKELIKICCRIVAESIRGKSTDEMREYLGLGLDSSSEEEERIRLESKWFSQKKFL